MVQVTRESVAQMMATIPPPTRRGLADELLLKLRASALVNVSGWQAQVDDLIIPFEAGDGYITGVIRLDNNATNMASIGEDTDLFRALAEIRSLDTDFILARHSVVFWQDATDEAPAVIYVESRYYDVFLARVLSLVTFIQSVLDYGAGAHVHEHLANQITLRNLTVRNLTEANAVLTEANGRLQAVLNAVTARRAS